MSRFLRAVFIATLFSTSALTAQINLEPGYKPLPLGQDTLCFRYKFEPEDTLAYVVDSFDSTKFEGQPLLIKTRSELIFVVCDSVDAQSKYHLRQVMIASREIQHSGKDTSVRTTNPWVGRLSYLIVDSLGRRLEMRSDDPTRALIGPGGAFQPLLIPTLGESCGRQNQSWLVEDTIALVENSVPPAAFNYSTLWRVLDKADSLGRNFLQIQYTQSGLGNLDLLNTQLKMNLKAKIASFGKVTFDKALQVPFHLFTTSEDRLTITTADGRERTGLHQVASHAQLVEVRSSVVGRRYILKQ